MSHPLAASQLQRCTQLLHWLQAGQSFTAVSAAGRLGVTVRTLRRDLDRLRDTWNVPVVWNATRRSFETTVPVAQIPAVPLSGRDFAALLVAQHALTALGDTASADLVRHAADRLADALPPSVAVPPHALADAMRFAPAGPRTDARSAWHLPLAEAVEAHRVVRLRYRSASKDETTLRDIEPYGLVLHAGRWYLVGFCHLRDGWRDFRLDRIETLETTAATFAPRPFDADAYLGESLGMHRGDRTYHVHVVFSARQARWLREEAYHPTQVATLRTDGRLDVQLSVRGLPDLVRWLLGYGVDVEVLAPAVLRRAVADAHRAAAALYARDPDPVRDN